MQKRRKAFGPSRPPNYCSNLQYLIFVSTEITDSNYLPVDITSTNLETHFHHPTHPTIAVIGNT